MNNPVYRVAIGIFMLLTIWDAFTTAYGTYWALNGTTGALFLGILAALAIGGFMILSAWVAAGAHNYIKIAWFAPLLYSLATSYFGNLSFVASPVFDGTNGISPAGYGILFMATIFTTMAPVVLSFLIKS